VGLVDDLEAVLDLFEGIDEPHMVVGGLALEALGVPRSTLDIDLQVRLSDPPADWETGFHGWFIAERSKDEIFGQPVLILEGKRTGVPIEMFLTDHWFTEQALDRRTDTDSGLLGRAIPVPSPEDFLLLKAAYSQAPDRGEAKANQDRLDVENVLAEHRDELDRPYLRENAEALGVWDTLKQSLEPE
jgi:hypothetical protein